jgi:hypothetical protein
MNATPILTQSNYDLLIGSRHQLAEIGQLEKFLEPFSEVGQYYILRLVVNARAAKKDFAEVMGQLQAMWQERWKNGMPHRIGDVNDVTPPGLGAMNAGGFSLVYKRLGMLAGSL